MTAFVNGDVRSALPADATVAGPGARRFHASLPGYAPSALVAAPTLAAELGVAAIGVKDESARLGLPSFKILGASWALAQALRERPGLERAETFDELRSALAGSELTLTCATDGNHGRAVASLARRLDLAARILVPDAVSPARAQAIRDEGADVVVLPVDYDAAVRAAAATADERTLVISDTSWPGYEQIPRWVLDGYATIFEEADEQLAARGDAAPDVVVVQIGVGAFAAAAVAHYKRAGRAHPARVLGVEPHDADCVLASLRAGELTTVEGPHRSAMDGLNCGTPSQVAWPLLRDGLDAVVTIDDDQVHDAMRDLARCGVTAGESGAAGLGGLRAATAAQPLRAALGLSPDTRVLLFSTEGATDPDRYRAVVGDGAA
jgi:diaminopropionate ammonia-lyase